MSRIKIRKRLGNITVKLFVTLISLISIFPIIWIAYSSLKTNSEFLQSSISLPTVLNFDNYIQAFITAKFSTYFLNSLINSVVSVLFICLFSFFIGFFIARVRAKIMRVVYYLLLAGMLIPVHGLLVPSFILFKSLDILNKFYTLWLPYIAFGLPLSVFLVESFVSDIPVEIEEAAFIDGCNIHQLIFKIIMPICRPVFATIVIINFLHIWNEFPYALVLLTKDTFRTIPIGLTFFTTQYTRNWTQMLAAMIIASAPVITLYIIMSKRVMQGMKAGAVKG